jgi:hypothetical protein
MVQKVPEVGKDLLWYTEPIILAITLTWPFI